MPQLDGEDKVVGTVLREMADWSYVRCFLVLDFSIHRLKVFPNEEAMNSTEATPSLELNCQYVTKVGIPSLRPKALNCFEIVTTTGMHYFSVDSTDEREEWIESIRKSSMRQGSAKQIVSYMQQRQQKDVGYRTNVVGGVVHRTPIQPGEGGDAPSEDGLSNAEEQSGAVGGVAEAPPTTHQRRTRGYPRIIKAGYGIKLGAVMKNWKKRFFVLSEASLGYYKTVEEMEPIKTIGVPEITAVSPTKEIAGKEHMFEVVTPSRTFYVQMEVEEEKQEWVRAFTELLRTVQRIPGQHSHNTATSGGMEDSDEELGTLV